MIQFIRIKYYSTRHMLLPPDADDRCGLYIHLPDGHPFNVVCKNLHDPGFVNHHDGHATNLNRLNKATASAWWGIAMEQKSIFSKAWYGIQAAIGTGIIYTIGPVVWVFGGGDGK